MTSEIERLYIEYSKNWFGECTEAVADRMSEIERLAAVAMPQSLTDRAMQDAIAECEEGALASADLLAQPPHFEPAVKTADVSGVARFYFEWDKLDGRDGVGVDLPDRESVCATVSRLETCVVDTPADDAGDVSLKVRFCKIQNERCYDIGHVLDAIERDLVLLNAERA